MFEKISDEPKRKNKIEKLKQKISKEINEKLRENMNETTENMSIDDLVFIVKQSFALVELKEYIDNHPFMDYESKNHNKDVVVYVVQEKDLDIWLQDDYSFVQNYLLEARKLNYDVFQMLNDHYFGYEFTNIFDSILYDKNNQSIRG